MTKAVADSLTATSWEILSQTRPAKFSWTPGPQNVYKNISVCNIKTLIFRVIGHAAKDINAPIIGVW